LESSDQAAHERSTFIPWIDHELISKPKKTLSGRELSRSFSNTEYPPPDTPYFVATARRQQQQQQQW
jgi:hypothetical protein